jgi:Adenylate cyclase regulatory domain
MDVPAFDRFAGLSGTTFQQLSAQTGIPLELLMVVREAVGFAEPRPQDPVHHNELKVVPAIQLQHAKGCRPVGIERWLRGCGDSLRRIAATETAGWRSEVVTALLASGMTEGEMLQAEADLGSRLAPLRSGEDPRPRWQTTWYMPRSTRTSAPLRGAATAQGPSRAAHLHRSGVAAGHKPFS